MLFAMMPCRFRLILRSFTYDIAARFSLLISPPAAIRYAPCLLLFLLPPFSLRCFHDIRHDAMICCHADVIDYATPISRLLYDIIFRFHAVAAAISAAMPRHALLIFLLILLIDFHYYAAMLFAA